MADAEQDISELERGRLAQQVEGSPEREQWLRGIARRERATSGAGLVDEFNRFFEGDASAVFKNGELEITVGSRTLQIGLPSIVGGHCGGSFAVPQTPS